MDKVYFPIFKEKIEYSKELINFFNSNNIKIENAGFDLQLLRKLSKTDIKLFYRLKTELELKGFNFELSNGFFQANINYDNFDYLFICYTLKLYTFKASFIIKNNLFFKIESNRLKMTQLLLLNIKLKSCLTWMYIYQMK